MTPQRFRELQSAADKGGKTTLSAEELQELTHNSIALMGEYARQAKEKAFNDAEIRAQDDAKKHPFRLQRQIFMGSGMMSKIAIGHAHSLLSEAFTILSGIQQPSSIHEKQSEEEEEDREAGRIRLTRIAQELFVGLTGKKVIQSEEVKDEET